MTIHVDVFHSVLGVFHSVLGVFHSVSGVFHSVFDESCSAVDHHHAVSLALLLGDEGQGVN